MPVKSKVQLRNVQNVAASKTALIDLPCGPRYHTVVLQHGYSAGTNTVAGACTNISMIRVKVNGKVQRTFTGTELRDLNLLHGAQYDGLGVPNTAPGVALAIHLAEPWLTDERDQDALAWATAGWSSFQIEVDLSSASTPTLAASAVIDGSTVGGLGGQICKIIRQSFAAAGTQFDISTIDRRDWLRAIHLYPDSGGSQTATQVELRLNGTILHELTYSANAAALYAYGMRYDTAGLAAGTRTSGISDVVMDSDTLLASAVPLDGAKDLTVTVKAGSAMSGSMVGLVVRVGPPE
jgi:hypothetical protein